MSNVLERFFPFSLSGVPWPYAIKSDDTMGLVMRQHLLETCDGQIQIPSPTTMYWRIMLNTPRPRQNSRHFADDIFKCIFVAENISISVNFSLTFVPKVRINNIPALVQMMAWRRPGDKPSYEPMMVSLQMYICVTRPQVKIYSTS